MHFLCLSPKFGEIGASFILKFGEIGASKHSKNSGGQEPPIRRDWSTPTIRTYMQVNAIVTRLITGSGPFKLELYSKRAANLQLYTRIMFVCIKAIKLPATVLQLWRDSSIFVFSKNIKFAGYHLQLAVLQQLYIASALIIFIAI